MCILLYTLYAICRLVVDDLEPERQYQFWVTAVTNAGEGMRSDILVQTPSKRGNCNQSNLIHTHLTG